MTAFRYWRWTPTRINGDPNIIQVSEFEFRTTTGPIGGATVTVTNSTSSSGEVVSYLADGSTATKWCNTTYSTSTPPVVTWDFGTSVMPTSYRWATGNDLPARDPVDWTVQYSPDNASWTTVSSVTNFTPPVARQTYTAEWSLITSGGSILGMNWPSASRVYLLGWDQNTITYANRATVWAAAAAAKQQIMRVFSWDDQTIAAYVTAKSATGTWTPYSTTGAARANSILANMVTMCQAAAAQGISLILSPRIDQPAVTNLNNGGTYANLAAAQVAITTSGSTPWLNYETLLKDTVLALQGIAGVYGYETTNEPAWMLGTDAGSITHDASVNFCDHFNALLKTAGAARVGPGDRPLYDPTLMTDAQVITFAQHTDWIDYHPYPPSTTDTGQSTVAQAQGLLSVHDTYVSRVQTLLSRPSMPVLIGEYGTLPWPGWAQAISEGARSRGWQALAWGFDAWDTYAFTTTTRPEVLAYITSVNNPVGSLAAPLNLHSTSVAAANVGIAWNSVSGAVGYDVIVTMGAASSASAAITGSITATMASSTSSPLYLARSGTSLTINGTPRHLTGINVYGSILSANLTGTLSTLYGSLGTPSANGAGMLIRFWAFQRGMTIGGVRDWTKMDAAIAAAKAHGYKVLPVLSNEGAADEAPSQTSVNTWWFQSGGDKYHTAEWFQTGYNTVVFPEWTVTMKAWCAEIAAHYANEPTVAMWEIINELELPADTAIDGTPSTTVINNFYNDVGGAIHAADPNHLVTSSVVGTGQYGGIGAEFETSYNSAGIDVIQIHEYSPNSTTLPGDSYNGMAARITQANDLNKPIIVGECGNRIGSTEAPDTQARATLWQQKITTQFNAGIRAWIAWSYVNPTGDAFDIGAGDPALSVIFSNGG